MYDIHKMYYVLDKIMYYSRSSSSRMFALGADGGGFCPPFLITS